LMGCEVVFVTVMVSCGSWDFEFDGRGKVMARELRIVGEEGIVGSELVGCEVLLPIMRFELWVRHWVEALTRKKWVEMAVFWC
jgi:hypothetical protein